MKRTNTLELKPTKKQEKILNELLIRSACLFNLGNYHKRQAFFNKQLIPSSYTLQKELKNHKDYKNLGAAYSQQTLNKLQENWDSYFSLIKSNKVKYKVNIPKYYKNRKINTTFLYILRCRNDCYRINREYLHIPCPKDLKIRYNIKKLIKIKTKGIIRWQGKQGHCEIKYDLTKKRFYALQTVSEVYKKGYINKRKIVYKNIKKVKNTLTIASIDFGIKRIITSLVNGECIAYDTQNAFEEYEKVSKEIFKYQQIIMNEWKDKNNKPTKYISKRIRKLTKKRMLRLNHLQNVIIKKLFNNYLQYNVNTIIIGNIKNIRNTYPKNKYNHRLNQMINNFWSFGKLMKKIENKAEEHGIKIIKIFEGYTSSTCPIDTNHIIEINDRNISCIECNNQYDRDVVGCVNIMKNYTHKAVETMPHLSVIAI